MSAPTDHGWTTQTLYEHFSRLREADQVSLKSALDAANARLNIMNEFRSTIQDVLAKAITRDEAGARFDALAEKIEGETKRGNIGEGRSEIGRAHV